LASRTYNQEVVGSTTGGGAAAKQRRASCSHPVQPCRRAIEYGIGQPAVTLCGWEGNHRSGITYAAEASENWAGQIKIGSEAAYGALLGCKGR